MDIILIVILVLIGLWIPLAIFYLHARWVVSKICDKNKSVT